MTSHLPDSPSEPEYLGTDPGTGPGSGPGSRSRRGTPRRTGVLTAAAVAVVAAVGLGGWGVAQLMSGGSSPATAVPGNAVGYLSMDLDPSASQKIEALKMLDKFPAIHSRLALGSRDDLRRWIFEQATKDSRCKGVDYGKDIAPWVGERIALAAVPSGTGKAGAYPLVVLQAGDQDAARAAVHKLDTCGGSGRPTGVAFVGDYLLLTERQVDADAAARAARQGSLDQDPTFQKWMDRVGDPGVVTAYASADAPALVSKLQPRAKGRLGGGPQLDKLGSLYKDFAGMAGVVRFHDGAVETELVAKGLPAGTAGSGVTGPSVATLPATTAAAFSVGLPHGWLSDYLDSMNQVLGGGSSLDEMFKTGEAQTGLRLPQDIETLLGDGISVSVDSSMDVAALRRAPDPTKMPFALRIKGDPAKITPIIDKLKAMAGPDAGSVVVEKGAGVVVVGLDRRYVDSLVAGGGLGSTVAFQDVVPHPDRASSVFYVNFDAGNGWAERLADLASGHDPKVRANVAPLEALGISSWQDADGVQHGLLRLTTN